MIFQSPTNYALSVASYSTTGNISVNDDVVLLSGASGAITRTLPTAVGYTKPLYIRRTDTTKSNAVTINTTGGQTINGSSSYVLYLQYEEVMLVSDGSNWQILNRFIPPVAARYSTNTVQNIFTSSDTVINFEDVDFDSHSCVTTGASWVFTAPVDGYYRVDVGLHNTTYATRALYANLTKTGPTSFVLMQNGIPGAGTTGATGLCSGTGLVSLTRGQAVWVTAVALGANDSIDGVSSHNWVSVTRIGD